MSLWSSTKKPVSTDLKKIKCENNLKAMELYYRPKNWMPSYFKFQLFSKYKYVPNIVRDTLIFKVIYYIPEIQI